MMPDRTIPVPGAKRPGPGETRGHPAALTTFFVAPLAIIVALLAVGEVTVNRVDHIDPHPVERLVVTGSQWQWSARYVKEGLSVSRSAQITLESSDVIHGFFVPGMLFMKNAVPGHPNTFTFTPTKPGTYLGQCTQFCGLWHSKMTLVLKVLPAPQFQTWVTQQRQGQSKGGSCAPKGSS